MLIRLSKSPILNTKLCGVLNEWGESELDPVELFRCPDNCYDVSDISSLMNEIQIFDKELSFKTTVNWVLWYPKLFIPSYASPPVIEPSPIIDTTR